MAISLEKKIKLAKALKKSFGEDGYDAVLKQIVREIESVRASIPTVPDTSPLKKDIENIKNQLNSLSVAAELRLQQAKDEQGETNEGFKEALESLPNTFKSLMDEIQILRNRVNSIPQHGGGNANRNIVVNGVTVLTPFTDINLIDGSGVGITAAANNTTKQTDITFTNSSPGVATPVSLANGGTAVANTTAADGTFLRGDGTGFATSTLTLPNTLTANQILYGTASNVVGAGTGLTYNGTVLGVGTSPSIVTGVIFHVNDGNAINAALISSPNDNVILSKEEVAPGFSIIAASSALAGHRGVFKAVRSRGTLGTPTVVVDGDFVFSLLGEAYDGAARRSVAAIDFIVDGTPGSGDMPGRIALSTTPDGSATRVERWRINNAGNLSNTQASGTAYLHLKAGTATASTAPLKLTTGVVNTTGELGALEFTDPDLFFVPTGTARKAFVFDNGTRLTSGRVPFATTNGRLVDDADMTFATDTLTVTKIVGTTSIKVGTAAGYISSDGSTGATGTFTSADAKTITVKDGIITSIV